MAYIRSQFGRLRGLLGILAGMIMARLNRKRNAWAVSLLDGQPADRVLEVGFGPGLAIRHMAEIVVEGFVACIDHSELMVRQAHNRNTAAIRQGRMEMVQGSASALPYSDESFDKVLAVNSIWPDSIESRREMQRVLKAGGWVAIALQPRWAKTDDMVHQVSEEMAAQLATAGLREIRLAFKPMKPVATVCVLSTK